MLHGWWFAFGSFQIRCALNDAPLAVGPFARWRPHYWVNRKIILIQVILSNKTPNVEIKGVFTCCLFLFAVISTKKVLRPGRHPAARLRCLGCLAPGTGGLCASIQLQAFQMCNKLLGRLKWGVGNRRYYLFLISGNSSGCCGCPLQGTAV